MKNRDELGDAKSRLNQKTPLLGVLMMGLMLLLTLTGLTQKNIWVEHFSQFCAVGTAPTTAQITSGWEALGSRRKTPFNIGINAGYATPLVHQKMVDVAMRQRNCHAVLDAPSDKLATADLINYRKYLMNVNARWGSLYAPDVEIVDPVTSREEWVGLSGHVAANYARTDRDFGVQWQPAGEERMQIRGIRRLRELYEEADADLLEPEQICVCVNYGAGPVIYAGETLQVNKSLFSTISISRMVGAIEVAAADNLYSALQQPNDQTNRFNVKQRLDAITQPFKDNRGGLKPESINLVSKDNNPPEVEAAGLMYATMALIPYNATKGIMVNIVVGTSIQEIIESEFVLG
jgi:hypothetical protein